MSQIQKLTQVENSIIPELGRQDSLRHIISVPGLWHNFSPTGKSLDCSERVMEGEREEDRSDDVRL